MKKFLLPLMIAVMTIAGVLHATGPVIAPKNDGAVVQMNHAAYLSSFAEDTIFSGKKIMVDFESAPSPAESEPEGEQIIEQSHYCDGIPLTHEEQDWLSEACEEFDVPYALALGLIEKETRFQNIIGDDGASAGYMQIQQKWHQDRMDCLGITDLLESSGNFRVGCDFLAELYAKYNDWAVALTVYNMGHNPGYITDYAKDVMGNYARWQEIIENYI